LSLIGEEIHVHQVGIDLVSVKNRPVDSNFVVIDPSVLAIQQHAEVGALFGGSFLEVI